MNPIQESIDALIEQYRKATADGVADGGEVFGMVSAAAMRFVQFVASKELSGEQKKAAVMDAVRQLYTRFVKNVNIQSIPDWMEPYLKAAGEELLIGVMDSFVEGFVKLLRVDAI